ncbi:MAG: hypothetical protein ACKOW8_04310, partial [Flavobacteriales bacterium]
SLKKQKLQGFVMRSLIHPGSRNEQDIYVLETERRGEIRLAMKENRAFEAEIFETFVNEEVVIEGVLRAGIFYVEEIRRMDDF